MLRSLGSLQRSSAEEQSHWIGVAWGAGSELVTTRHEKILGTFASALIESMAYSGADTGAGRKIFSISTHTVDFLQIEKIIDGLIIGC